LGVASGALQVRVRQRQKGYGMMENPTASELSRLWIKDIKGEERVGGSYLVKEKSLGKTRNGKPFIRLTLGDRTGEMEARVWEEAEKLSTLFEQGDVIEISGDAEAYRGQIQITISQLKAVKEAVEPDIFLESAPGDPSEMLALLKEILRKVKNIHMRALMDRFLVDRHFIALFKKAPAAKNFHHNYLGGLLEHTLSVCRLATQVAAHYPKLDGDLLLTAAFLHDIGKTRELTYRLSIDYTDEGRLLGHLVLGAAMVDEKLLELRNFPRDLAIRLKHLILSHHGQYEFGSPKRPKFLEAFALHLVDDLDAKMNGLGRFMEKDRQEGAWTEFHRLFDRFFLKGELVQSESGEEDRDGEEEKQGRLFFPNHDP